MSTPKWWSEAACVGLAPMWDESLSDRLHDEPPAARTERMHRAALICGRCTVRRECLADAQLGRDEGIRSGMRLTPLHVAQGRRHKRSKVA